MVATALDLGLRGAVAGLFLMIMVVTLVRVRPLDTIKWLGIAMAASGVVYAIARAPLVPKATVWWIMPVLAANPVLVWLWARASFDDDFVVRRWHGGLWLAVVGVWFSVIFTWTTWPMFAKAGVRSMSIVAIALALSAAVQTVRTWKTDLVAGRRRLRLAVLILSLLIVVLLSVPGLTSIPANGFGTSGSLATAAGLLGHAGTEQQQRVAIARAIVSDPALPLCDEPTGDLDRDTADEVLSILQVLNRDLGKTIVMVTHDPAAAQYAKRSLHLDKGHFIEKELAA